jgi:hypothetical protein
MKSSTEPFVMLPNALLDDEKLDAIDVLVYCTLRRIDVDNDGVSLVSLKRIGERVHRGERTAERHIRRLEAAGWLQPIDNGRGRCCSYRLLTPVKHVGGHEKRTPATHDGSKTQAPAIGDAEPLPSVTKTPATDDQLPRRYLNSFPDRLQLKENTTEECRKRLVGLLTVCLKHPAMAEKEADRLLQWFPHSPRSLVAHLEYAVNERLEEPIVYVTRRTQRGDSPQISGFRSRQAP